MREIELSDSTYERLLTHVERFGETADEVISRLLTEVDGARGGGDAGRRSRSSGGSIVSEREYWLPLLSLLSEAGGAMSANEAIERMGDRMADRLSDRDYEGLGQGEVRWRNRVRFARLRMKEQGLLSSESPRGVWEITDSGRRFLSERG